MGRPAPCRRCGPAARTEPAPPTRRRAGGPRGQRERRRGERTPPSLRGALEVTGTPLHPIRHRHVTRGRSLATPTGYGRVHAERLFEDRTARRTSPYALTGTFATQPDGPASRCGTRLGDIRRRSGACPDPSMDTADRPPSASSQQRRTRTLVSTSVDQADDALIVPTSVGGEPDVSR